MSYSRVSNATKDNKAEKSAPILTKHQSPFIIHLMSSFPEGDRDTRELDAIAQEVGIHLNLWADRMVTRVEAISAAEKLTTAFLKLFDDSEAHDPVPALDRKIGSRVVGPNASGVRRLYRGDVKTTSKEYELEILNDLNGKLNFCSVSRRITIGSANAMHSNTDTETLSMRFNPIYNVFSFYSRFGPNPERSPDTTTRIRKAVEFYMKIKNEVRE